MSKITLIDLTNLQNETSAVTNINANNSALENAFDNTLSRDGSAPNQMAADIDMNGNRVLNLPTPSNNFEPLRLADINTALVVSNPLKADLASPHFTGIPTAPTASQGNNSTQLSTTAYVDTGLVLKSNIASPTFTGTVTTPNLAMSGHIDLEPTIVSTGTFGVANEAFRILAIRSGNAAGGSARLVDIQDENNSVDHSGGQGKPETVFISNFFSGTNDGVYTVHAVTENTKITTPASAPGWYVGIQSDVAAAYGSGGSAGAANVRGSWQGINAIVSARSGATFLNGIGGAEFDVCLNAGSSAQGKIALNLVSGDGGVASDANHALDTDYDTALQITAATTDDVGFYQGINIGSKGFGWPIAAGGSILTTGATANARTCSYGIDLSGATISQAAFKSTGFTIDGSGNPSFMSATAIPAGGTTGSGLKLSSTSNFGIFFGSNVPTLVAAKGSLYLRSDGSSSSTRAYINTDGGTTWTSITTAA